MRSLAVIGLIALACQSAPPEKDPKPSLEKESTQATPPGEPVCTQHGLQSLQAWLTQEGFVGPKAEVLIARSLLKEEVCPTLPDDIRVMLEAHAHPETLNPDNTALVEAAQRQVKQVCDSVFLMKAQTLSEKFTACFGHDSALATPDEAAHASSALITAGFVHLAMVEGGADPELSRAIIRRFTAIEPRAE